MSSTTFSPGAIATRADKITALYSPQNEQQDISTYNSEDQSKVFLSKFSQVPKKSTPLTRPFR
jgi:hypothetical protein